MKLFQVGFISRYLFRPSCLSSVATISTKENISGTAAVIHHILVITRIRFVDFQRTGSAETVDGKQKSLQKQFFFWCCV